MLLDLGVCMFTHIHVHANACSCIWEHVDLCWHIKIDGCDTERLVFLDSNLVFLCVPSPCALSASIRLEGEGFFFFSPPHSSLFPYFPLRHTAYLTGKGGGGRRWRRVRRRRIQQDTNPTISGMR